MLDQPVDALAQAEPVLVGGLGLGVRRGHAGLGPPAGLGLRRRVGDLVGQASIWVLTALMASMNSSTIS